MSASPSKGQDQFAHDWQYIPAGQTNVLLKGQRGSGKQFDRIVKIIGIPLTNAPGAITMKDGATGTPFTVWQGGAGGVVPNLEQRCMPMDVWPGMTAFVGPWYATTGANVALLVIGRFH